MVAVLPYYIFWDTVEKYTAYLDKQGKSYWDIIPQHILAVLAVLFLMLWSAQFYRG